jgi:DNA replication protein DnaC
VCSICGDAGFYRLDVPFGDPRFGRVIRCECKAVEDSQRLQRLSGLTDQERRVRLCDIETEGLPGTASMVRACRDFVVNPVPFLTLWGGPGNAKSTALQSLVNEFVGRSVEAVYITAFDLLSHIKAAFTKNPSDPAPNDDAYSRLLRFASVRVLAIDEFEKVRLTEWALEQITDLIDRRYRLGRDGQAFTVLAMNDDPRNLSPWIASRLKEFVIVHNTDSDMRELFRHPYTGEVIG